MTVFLKFINEAEAISVLGNLTEAEKHIDGIQCAMALCGDNGTIKRVIDRSDPQNFIFETIDGFHVNINPVGDCPPSLISYRVEPKHPIQSFGDY